MKPIPGLLVSFLGLVVTGCAKSPSVVAQPPKTTTAVVAPATTNGAIAMGNVAAQIAGLEKTIAAEPQNWNARLGLSALLRLRGQVTSRITDLEAALAVSEEAVTIAPRAPQARLSRAAALSSFHRFRDALADVDFATEHGLARQEELVALRASILAGMGRLAEAIPLAETLAAEHPTLVNLGQLAVMYRQAGQLERAEATFAAAAKQDRVASPFPWVWLWFEQARAIVDSDDATPAELARARHLLVLANERLPAHVGVATHLAEVEGKLGDVKGAVARLRKVVASTDNPEPLGDLATLLRENGDLQEAEETWSASHNGFARLLARYPDAFADHAGRFYLASGHPAMALPLVLYNLEVRPTLAALVLAQSATASVIGIFN